MAKRYRDLTDYLNRSGETQEELAARVGVTQPTISNVKTGKTCGFRLARRIHRATGIPLDALGPEE